MEENGRVYANGNIFKKNYYEIREEGLYVRTSTFSTKHEFNFAFDIIPLNQTFYMHRSKTAFWLMVVFTFFFLLGFVMILFTQEKVDISNFFIWGPCAAITSAWYFFSRKNYLIFECPNGGRFSICFPKRHVEEVNKFISRVEQAKLNYFEKKIKQYLSVMGRDRINSLIIQFRENMIINNDGYEYLMKKAEETDSIDVMGFQKRNSNNVNQND